MYTSVPAQVAPPEQAFVEAAADYAYTIQAELLGYSPETIHRERVCHEVAKTMVTHMVEQGVDARQDGTAYHSYAAIPRPGQEDILADGTWQQFLPPKRLQGDAVLPKVLVGTRAEVISAAHAYGVHEGDLGAWKAKDPEQSNNLRIVVPPLD